MCGIRAIIIDHCESLVVFFIFAFFSSTFSTYYLPTFQIICKMPLEIDVSPRVRLFYILSLPSHFLRTQVIFGDSHDAKLSPTVLEGRLKGFFLQSLVSLKGQKQMELPNFTLIVKHIERMPCVDLISSMEV